MNAPSLPGTRADLITTGLHVCAQGPGGDTPHGWPELGAEHTLIPQGVIYGLDWTTTRHDDGGHATERVALTATDANTTPWLPVRTHTIPVARIHWCPTGTSCPRCPTTATPAQIRSLIRRIDRWLGEPQRNGRPHPWTDQRTQLADLAYTLTRL